MGCDGGTIPKRHELIKTAKRPAQKDKDMDRNAKWSSCAISQQGLLPPIMCCELGKLYSKESVLEFLLDRSISDSASHIRSLKDVKELKLTKNIGYKKPLLELADQYHETQSSEYVCPVVGIEMNGKYKFCVLWTCGCVLSERALKEIDTLSCHSCGVKFTKDNIVIINPEETDVSTNESNMIKRRELAKLVRKEKKDSKDAKRKLDQASFKIPAAPLSKESSTSSIDSNQSVKRTKVENKTLNTVCKVQQNKEKITTSSEEIPDAKKSKVYKSLFSSSEESKNRDRNKISNWVTYNPYHL
ncbi:replication termination factor 2 isoform X2 [Hydra vulgaris]|uniref:Replication termination factor 2 n=1 Tax=Hydra vulgaris TaxID=6087 RepID=A0ABM4BH85_HYDVU